MGNGMSHMSCPLTVGNANVSQTITATPPGCFQVDLGSTGPSTWASVVQSCYYYPVGAYASSDCSGDMYGTELAFETNPRMSWPAGTINSFYVDDPED